MRGTVTRRRDLKVAYFAQHQLDELEPTAQPYDHVRRAACPTRRKRKCARASAPSDSPGRPADTQVEKLSGGEKARLLLGLATFGAPHLLILDEPTNHLDIDSRAALIEAHQRFPGRRDPGLA